MQASSSASLSAAAAWSPGRAKKRATEGYTAKASHRAQDNTSPEKRSRTCSGAAVAVNTEYAETAVTSVVAQGDGAVPMSNDFPSQGGEAEGQTNPRWAPPTSVVSVPTTQLPMMNVVVRVRFHIIGNMRI